MRYQWIAAEHHRLHLVEGWSDSPYKDATLRAIHSKLASLTEGVPASFAGCNVCLSRRRASTVVTLRMSQQGDRAA